MRKIILGVLVLAVIAIQFIRIDKSVPETDPSEDFANVVNADPNMLALIKQACYDCHSYDSEYPWYAEVAPVSWWIKGHINHGREHLNFSIWEQYDADRKDHKLEEVVEMLESKSMPLKSFTWLHSEARLSAEERQSMIRFFEGLRL